MKRVSEAKVASGKVAVWWLGQSGYVFKDARGVTLAVDPYLSDSCGTKPSSKRMVPVPIEPEEFAVDVYCCTHDHADHLDPETVSRYGAKDTTTFVGPRNVRRHLVELGIPPERIVQVDAGDEQTVRGIAVRGTFALATDYDSLDGMGCLLTFDSGTKAYITGDTAYANLLGGVARYRPDLMCVVINRGYGNLDIYEAAVLTAVVKPKLVVPSHYGMFPGNTVDPEEFPPALEEIACDVPCKLPRLMEAFVI